MLKTDGEKAKGRFVYLDPQAERDLEGVMKHLKLRGPARSEAIRAALRRWGESLGVPEVGGDALAAIGRDIAARRKVAGLTQDALGQLAGLSRGTVSNIEQGRSGVGVTPENVDKVRAALAARKGAA